MEAGPFYDDRNIYVYTVVINNPDGSVTTAQGHQASEAGMDMKDKPGQVLRVVLSFMSRHGDINPDTADVASFVYTEMPHGVRI